VTDWERAGGERLREIVGAFVRRMSEDFVIGFRFEGKDLERIAHHEHELAAAHLGGPRSYGGRSLQEAHRPMRINRGQFLRRLAVLRTVLQEHGVPADVIDRWIAHDEALIDVIADPTDCVPR
jgi:truncated hemoglobin YjbI